MSGLEQLRADEGWSAVPYTDSRGVLTIGIGHRLDLPLCAAAIEAQFAHDVAHAQTRCATLACWATLSAPRQDVLVNMCFNLGFRGLTGFRRMLAALDRRAYGAAAAEMRASRWAAQVPARAARLALQMEHDG